jgi:hypothetical protein
MPKPCPLMSEEFAIVTLRALARRLRKSRGERGQIRTQYRSTDSARMPSHEREPVSRHTSSRRRRLHACPARARLADAAAAHLHSQLFHTCPALAAPRVWHPLFSAQQDPSETLRCHLVQPPASLIRHELSLTETKCHIPTVRHEPMRARTSPAARPCGPPLQPNDCHVRGHLVLHDEAGATCDYLRPTLEISF